MELEINESVICVLKKSRLTNQIEVDYVSIENVLSDVIQRFCNICDNPDTDLQQIKAFLQENKELDLLSGYHRYCVDLGGAYQAFTASNQGVIVDITNKQKAISEQLEKDTTDDITSATELTEYKLSLKCKYTLWGKAYAINKTYRLCHQDSSVLTFSHRIDGWANPVYQLTPNFSIEIKTNFGYGSSSYFYTKLKYKDIEITPFSDWVNYEHAKFEEIVRYTQSHLLEDKYWLEAMSFSQKACNLSITNESRFVEEYVIKECEKLVEGLEGILCSEQFIFIKEDKETCGKRIQGRKLVEFRGEKISGALAFISKILKLESIASIESFVAKIESCNRKIQPALIDELKLLSVEITNLFGERDDFKPEYDKVIKTHNEFRISKFQLQELMLNDGQLNKNNMNYSYLEHKFKLIHPNYEAFMETYRTVTAHYRALGLKIRDLNTCYSNIYSCSANIAKYFNVSLEQD